MSYSIKQNGNKTYVQWLSLGVCVPRQTHTLVRLGPNSHLNNAQGLTKVIAKTVHHFCHTPCSNVTLPNFDTLLELIISFALLKICVNRQMTMVVWLIINLIYCFEIVVVVIVQQCIIHQTDICQVHSRFVRFRWRSLFLFDKKPVIVVSI